MNDVLRRLYRIARARIPRPTTSLRETVEETLLRWEERIRERDTRKERHQGKRDGRADNQKSSSGRASDGGNGTGEHRGASSADPVTADLAVFGLIPPSSLAEVKKARNREIKKYHPDRFQNDPERQCTAKEIMQIYNTAYDRLRVHYEGQG